MRRSSVTWDLEPWALISVPYDSDFLAAFKEKVYIRAFDQGTKQWCVPARYVPIVRELVKRYLGVELAVPLTPNLAPHAKREPAKVAIPDEYTTLCILPGAPPEVVKASYKALAFLCHPDRGGNAEHFRQLTNAYEKVLHGIK